MLRATPETMRRKAQQQDVKGFAILSLVAAAASVSVLAISFMLADSKHSSPTLLAIHLTLAFLTIVGTGYWCTRFLRCTMPTAITGTATDPRSNAKRKSWIFPEKLIPTIGIFCISHL